MPSRTLIPAALLCLAATRLAAGDAPALPVAVPTGDPHLGWSGRWDGRDAAGPRCAWPACAVRLHFRGTAVNALLGGPGSSGFQVVVDGKPTATLELTGGQSVYAVASGLAAGEHTVELWRRNEAFQGVVQVKGFQLAEGAALLPAPKPTRRIEFIGDSITAGYGNEAASKEEHFTPKTENAWLAWGPVAARTLKADVMVEAWSGIWLMDNGKDQPMPKRWELALPMDAGSRWDFAKWQADAVVVNLGTNDSNRPIDEKPWTDAYRGLIASIRSHYPKAHIFLTIGAMGWGPKECIPAYNERIAAALAQEGDKLVHAVKLANQRQEDGIGADWHPSVKTHQIMADTIAAAIRKELGW
jgi:lysophospholipase L1-like esterase